MKLGSPKVVFMQRCRIRLNIIGLSDGEGTNRSIITMYEINIIVSRETMHQRRGQVVQGVPTHSRNLLFEAIGTESFHINREHPNAIRIAFLRMPTQQLLAYANAQNGLCEGTNHFIQTTSPEIIHRSSSISLPREDNTVSLSQPLSVVSQLGFNTLSFQSAYHREYISRIIFNDGNFHFPFKFRGIIAPITLQIYINSIK